MQWPTITAIVNTYKRPKLLRRALHSVLSQSFIEFELLVIHDGPADKETADLCEEFDRKFAVRDVDFRFVALEENSGYQCVPKPSATTDEEGFFELQSLPEGLTQIRCRASSLHQETSIFDIYKVSTKPWDKPEDIKIVMSGTGLVCGKVVGIDGKPPKRAFIAEIEPKGGNKIGSWGGSMQCKKDGSFEFKGVPPGEYIVITFDI